MANARQPLIVVVGATGTGKSKLAVELATKFNGEIINADAVQMYKGLPIVTNKIPDDEKMGIEHHLLDEIGMEQQPWTVLHFLEEASKIIDGIRKRGKLPIVVGGTNYYIYSLLFKEATVGPPSERPEQVNGQDLSILEESNEVVYAKLVEVDPEMAKKWHPNDRRKYQRSLEIWLTTGRKPSEIYAEQKVAGEEGEEGQALRYDPLIFWIEAESDVLKQRLNDRVDAMVRHGLLDEVKLMREFEKQAKAEGRLLDTTKGIWVAIGYKELGGWLDLSEDQQEGDDRAVILAEGIESVKSSTRHYARRQNNWVRIKVAQNLQQANKLDRLMLLDGSNISQWNENVTEPSQAAATAFLAGHHENQALQSLAAYAYERVRKDLTRPAQETHYCETCQQTLMNFEEWNRHLKGTGHKRVLARNRKRAERDAYFARIANEASEKSESCTTSAHGQSGKDAPNNTI